MAQITGQLKRRRDLPVTSVCGHKRIGNKHRLEKNVCFSNGPNSLLIFSAAIGIDYNLQYEFSPDYIYRVVDWAQSAN